MTAPPSATAPGRRGARPRRPRGLQDLGRLGIPVALALSACALAALVLELWRTDLSRPLFLVGDSRFNLMLVKGLLEQGSLGVNPALGAPLGQRLEDFPEIDVVSRLLLEAIALATSDPSTVMNVFFLLTFPLVALAAYPVLRWAGASRAMAFAAALLFTFLPYHLYGNQSNLWLSAYWAVPLTAYLMLGLLSGRALFERRAEGGGAIRAWATRRSLLTAGACVVVSSTWFYYPVFSILLVAVAAALAALARRDRRTVITGAVVVGALVLVLGLHLAPYLVERATAGPASQYGARAPAESERFSLKLMTLITPIPDHRVDRLAGFSRAYDSTTPGYSGGIARLGLAGTIGLAILLAGLGVRALGEGRTVRWRRYGPPAVAAAIALLFGTTGALGSVFAHVVTPQLRAWNRMSVYIGFLALLALAFALDDVIRRARRRALAGPALAALVVAVGVLDQTTPAVTAQYPLVREAWQREAAYAAAVERRLPRGSSVFQLPYVPFPEPPPVATLPYYEQLTGYLHSDRLRWSFGDLKGTDREWRDALAGRPPGEVLPAVAATGFRGLELHRAGYRDGGARVVRALRRELGREAVRRADGQVLLWDLRRYRVRVRARLGGQRLAALRARTLRPR